MHQNSKMLFPFSYLESHMFKHYKSSHWGLGGAGGFVRIQRFHRDKACQRQRAEASLFSTRASHSYSSFLHLMTSPSDFVRAPDLLNSSSKDNFNFWAICVLIFWFLVIALAIVFDNYGSSTTKAVALVLVISCYCHQTEFNTTQCIHKVLGVGILKGHKII